ncbi:hypothetical protein [Marinobacter sp. BW6]|uniref:hypothetical protein n=1 Tax=Marinobacter sp. BW6 TaxID=2592624 RepID=UPI001966E5D6|nr:hypothetical protein [Marinobacter sp. BW6]
MIGWFGRDKNERPLPKEHGPLSAAIGGALEIDFLSLEADALAGRPAKASASRERKSISNAPPMAALNGPCSLGKGLSFLSLPNQPIMIRLPFEPKRWQRDLAAFR